MTKIFDRKQKAAEYIKELLESKSLPRNHVSALSGLSNSYIQHLENGQIANVGRKKLIDLAVSLGLDLFEVDELLTQFDRAKLDEMDIPLFIEQVGDRKLSTALLPIQTWFNYELFVMSQEKKPGETIIVNNQPTANLLPAGHRTYRNQHHRSSKHPIFFKLIEAAGQARQNNFIQQLKKYSTEHYICIHCLEDYLFAGSDETRKTWRYKHIQTLIDFVGKYKNFKLSLTNYCPRFNFTIKKSPSKKEIQDKLFFMGDSKHSDLWDDKSQLIGFATENKAILQNFWETLKTVQDNVIIDSSDRDQLTDFLRKLLIGQTDPGQMDNK